MNLDEVLKILVQATVIVVGWIVVHRLSAKRDRDKARREMVAKATDSLIDEITEFFAIAKEYHTKERDVLQEDVIKMTLQDISARIILLSEICSNKAELSLCKNSLLALKKSVTGAHFEDEHDGPILPSAAQVQALTDEVLRTKRYFLQLKHKQFPAE